MKDEQRWRHVHVRDIRQGGGAMRLPHRRGATGRRALVRQRDLLTARLLLRTDRRKDVRRRLQHLRILRSSKRSSYFLLNLLCLAFMCLNID